MDRREFCRRLAITGGSVVLAPLLNACASDSPTNQLLTRTSSKAADIATKNASSQAAHPDSLAESALDVSTGIVPLDDSALTKVALVKTENRADGIRQALDLLDFNGIRGDKVLLKPNLNSADVSPGSTHPDTLEAIIRELYDHGAGAITVGDRSGMGNTREVMRDIGLLDLAAELGFSTLAFDELEAGDWTIIRSNEFHWSDGFPVPRLLLDADSVIQTCNLKTHRYGGHFTMALKNSVGLVARKDAYQGHDFMSELHESPFQRSMIAEINTAYKPDLIVMDGIEAFVTGGPDTGRKVKPGVILASTDPIAMDAVGVSILRLFGTTAEVSKGRVFEQEQIARAVELDLGITSPQQIQLVTSGEGSDELADQLYSLAAT